MTTHDPLAQSFDYAHRYLGTPLGNALPIRRSIPEIVAARAATAGNDRFLTVSSAGHEAHLTYADLDACARSFAAWLQKDLAIGPRAVVAVIPRNDLASVTAIFGAIRGSRPLLLLNPGDPPERLRRQVEATGAEIVLRSPDLPDEVFPQSHVLPDAAALGKRAAEPSTLQIKPLADALLFGTSGSTAASKIVVQSHYNAAVNAEAVRRHHRLRRGDRVIGCLPLHHVNGVHFTLFATAAAGAHALLAPGFNLFDYPAAIARFRPKVASVVPSILEALLQKADSVRLPPTFGYFLSAAAPLSAVTAAAVCRDLGPRVLQGYGLTETTNFSTTMPLDLSPDQYDRFTSRADIPSIGTALYGNEVTVLREDGSTAADGEIGEICIRGHSVMMRYEKNPEATANAFRGGWFHSEDLGLARLDPESGRRLFFISGRIKNIAKVGGESVSLDEVERALRAMPGIADAACVALPHRLLGEEIFAAVVPVSSTSAVDLIPLLRRVLPSRAIPRRVVHLDVIPRTPTGKVRRPALTSEVESVVGPEGRWYH